MINRYRFTAADGDPQWSKGWRAYKEMYSHVWDRLRFHRGKGFKIDDQPPVQLVGLEDKLHKFLDDRPKDVVHTVEAVSDGYKIKVERIETEDLHGQDIIDHLRNAIGTRYVLGGASLAGMDCSGSTLWSHAFEGVDLPHNAAQQHDEFRNQRPGFHLITKAQIKPGDLVFFHNDDHVATYLDTDRVIDAEPHDAPAPSGWPSSYLGTGLRVRPMTGDYYAAWKYSNGIGRITQINGPVI